MPDPILAATEWRTNGDLIADCARHTGADQ